MLLFFWFASEPSINSFWQLARVLVYNGTTNLEDTVTYRLSEMFSRPVGDPSVELVVTVLNVNHGHNKELMELCKALKGYSIFVSKVRQYNQICCKQSH